MPMEAGIPGAGTLNSREHTKLTETEGNKRVEIWGPNDAGTAFNRARVADDGTLKTSGTGGGGGGTVDQGAAGTDPWPVLVQEPLSVDDGGSSLTVDATNLDIRDLTASDTVTVVQPIASALNAHVIGDKAQDTAVPSNPVIVGGRASAAAPANVDADDDAQYFWLDRAGRAAVWDGNNSLSIDDGGNSVTVDANNLDIRDLSSASDSVTADTELPAAAALADDMSNPTTPLIGACSMEYDGSSEANWDRVRHSYYQRTTGVSGGTSTTAINMTECPMQFFTLTIVKTGTVTAFNIDFEGSMDSAVWFLIANRTSATGANEATHHVTKPWRYVRVTANTITGGGTEIIDILCMR